MMLRLSERRRRIASGGTSHCEATRRRWLKQWKAEGFDVSEFDRAELAVSCPPSPVEVDVLIPFCSADAQYLPECLDSIFRQRHAKLTVHVISDGAPWPCLPTVPANVSLQRYETPGEWGPYRCVNGVVKGENCRKRFMALQDADDISLPDRLWAQVQILRERSAKMISSAMQNFISPGTNPADLVKRLESEPIIYPGATYGTSPRGRCINGTRLMTAHLFRSLNGFADIFCTGDFEFDNRCRFSGIRIVDDNTVRGRRRFHSSSLTNGSFRAGTSKRKADVDQVLRTVRIMQANPTLSTARRLGCLDSAEPLHPIVAASGVLPFSLC